MVMSDLHLEFYDVVIPKFPALAPNLILAGDIGRPDIQSLQEFLLAQCERFEHIFYVAGNHCFYEGIYEERLEQLQQLDNLHPHIHFLHNKSYILPNKVRVLGTTLWSHVSPENADEIRLGLSDYHYISTLVDNQTPCLITVEDTNKWHEQQHAWLLEEIEKARENDEHVVVITHHAPSRHGTCSKRHEGSALTEAFVNDHDADCVDPVRLWFYGHTHLSTDLKLNSTRVISNQLGYSNQDSGFRPNMKVNLHEDGTVTVTD
jgi:hypothetical protein